MKKAHSGDQYRAMLGFAACVAGVAFTAFPGDSTDRPTQADTALRREAPPASPRARLLIDDDWRFTKGDPPNTTTALNYDVRPQVTGRGGAPAAPVSAGPAAVAKSWMLPTGNNFLKDPQERWKRPDTNLGDDVP